MVDRDSEPLRDPERAAFDLGAPMRLGLISDIHGNRLALEACLERLASESPDEVVCLGDVVGYGPDPAGCVSLIRKHDIRCVLGNHDVAVVNGEGLEHFNAIAHQAVVWTREQLSARATSFLERLPRTLVVGDVTCAHGSPADTHCYVITGEDAEVALSEADTPLVAVGHTHSPLLHVSKRGKATRDHDFPISRAARFASGARVLVNPGSVGQPRDGVPESACAILDTDARTFAVHRVAYDVSNVMDAMRALDLPELLAMRLAVGE